MTDSLLAQAIVCSSHSRVCPTRISAVYATGKDQEAEVVTGDADLKDLPGVVYVK